MNRTIATGVGGGSGPRALAWAIAEAAGSRACLVLVRACPSCSPLAQLTGEPPVLRAELADPELARTVSAAAGRPGVPRRLQIMVGDTGTALADASAGADLLVIGASGGAVAARVAGRAHCPVVVVRPAGAEQGGQFAGHVVVGVDGSDAGSAALDFAFEYAAGHRLPLAATHVDSFAPSPPPGSSPPGRVAGPLGLLAAEVEPWELKYPQVPVRRAVLSGTVADGLAEAAEGAALLVIGAPPRPGRVLAATVARAGCPVAAVPAGRDTVIGARTATATGVAAPAGPRQVAPAGRKGPGPPWR